MKNITKLLVANRGEIACRVFRTARKMGLRTVAVYSEADADALHPRQADEAVALAGSLASETYLSIPALLDAARRTGADAVHPGYGFLSENADFAKACLDAGLVFVGPKPEAMLALGTSLAPKTWPSESASLVWRATKGIIRMIKRSHAKPRGLDTRF